MRFQFSLSLLALLLGASGCLPSQDGETSSFLGGLGAEFTTCYEVAACADSDSPESCISRATSDAGSQYSSVNQCYLACNGDEACENRCQPLVSSCFCGDQAIYIVESNTCADPSQVPWKVALLSYDVAEWCGADGIGADEFFYRAYADGELMRDSSTSDCIEGRAYWPLSEAFPYSPSQLFSLDIIEYDQFSDDNYVLGYGWTDEAGNLTPIPVSLLIAGYWGATQVAGAMEIGVTR
jgi:hypothetical protein